ncbi:MAG: hypothetical protein IJ682_06185 [Lachnospiraceae bacterium]|nr:hypothetical protein [Lachnospiraceae bacterium]
MTVNDSQFLKKRLAELAEKSYRTNTYCFSDFLSPADAGMAYEVCEPARLAVWGGSEAAERVMVRFGNPEEFGYEAAFPITVVCISPMNEKFAENLSHRDFLGALMNLGIERGVLGDILLSDGKAYAFVAERMADFVVESLHRVRHTDVRCAVMEDLPETALPRLERKTLVAASVRLDGIVAKLYHFSRSAAKAAFAKQEIFINGRVCTNPSVVLKEDDVISVRHKGKCIFRGISHETRKGNQAVELDVYV